MHLARISNDRLPKMCLFGWLRKTRPSGGLRRRWRDVVRKDLNIWESVRVTGMGLPRTEWIGGGGGVLLSVSSNS